jgi:hypothetical protein
MQEIRFRMQLSPAEVLAYYQGTAREVVARALDGRIVRFPASTLRAHVTLDGVRGLFALRFDDNNKLVELVRLSD